MKLTTQTTRQDYAAHLKAKATTKFGTNTAIAAHAKKVEAMSDADWLVHRAKLLERQAALAPTVARLTRQLTQKYGRA